MLHSDLDQARHIQAIEGFTAYADGKATSIVDIDAVVNAVFFGEAKKVVAHSPSKSWAYTPNLNP